MKRVQMILAVLLALAPVWRTFGADVPSSVFTNSLGMPFAKVPGTKVWFCIWHTRVQDFSQWLKVTGKTAEAPGYQQGPTHPAVNVTWDEAKAFCEWLTNKERKAGSITATQS